MNYTEFKNKWLGKPINYDNAYGAQCMDVYRMYVKEVLLCPQSPPVQGAKDVWNTYLPEFFDRIDNTPTGVPNQGDIVIWGMSPYGHIAICDHASTSTLTCFEQNWVELDGSGVTELRLHGNYNNVLGWLKFKKPQGESMTDEQKRILEFIGGRTEGDVREAFGALSDKIKLEKENLTLKNLSDDLASKVKELTEQLVEEQKNGADWQSELKTANKEIEILRGQIEVLTKERNDYKRWYEKAKEDLRNLDKMTAWQHIRYGIKLLIKQSK